MEIVLLFVFGLVGWFVAVWLRNDWNAAMKSIPGRMVSSTTKATRTGVGFQAKRQRAKRGLFLEDHRAKEATEVIDIEHDKHLAPKTVLVCASDKNMAFARVASSLKPGGFQITTRAPGRCDLVRGRGHHEFVLRKRSR